MRTLVLALALAALPTVARADQCALNSPGIAEAAARLVPPGSRVVELCEPCGDRAPGTPYTAKKVVVRNGELLVNDDAVDLAYFYVQTDKTEFRNVGHTTGCGASRISAFIRDGKPSGMVMSSRRPAPSPASLPRATSSSDLVGTWTVKFTTVMSSCSVKPSGPDETWWIDVGSSGMITIASSGTIGFEGVASRHSTGSFTHSLNATQAASSAMLRLSQSFRDKLWGTLVIGTPTGHPTDPVCVTQLNVAGNRQP